MTHKGSVVDGSFSLTKYYRRRHVESSDSAYHVSDALVARFGASGPLKAKGQRTSFQNQIHPKHQHQNLSSFDSVCASS